MESRRVFGHFFTIYWKKNTKDENKIKLIIQCARRWPTALKFHQACITIAGCTLSCRRRLSSSVTRMGDRPPPGWARVRSGGRHCKAGQYGYVPLGRHLV